MKKKCKHCKSEIEKDAKVCPNCRKKQGFPKWIIVVGVILLIGIIASTAGNESDEISSSEVTDNKSAEKKDTKAKVEKFSYTVDSQYNDSFSYYIEGTVVNNKDRDYSYVQIEFICYDAEGNNLGTAIDNTNNLLGNQTWKYKAAFIGDNESVDHCDFHEITEW